MRFYTYSPIDYPWVLRNIHQKPLDWAIHEIVDIGIHDLLKTPHRHAKEKLDEWKALQPEGWKAVPDAPDIDREFNMKSELDNVEYSRQLLLDYYDPDEESHLPVVQGYYHNPRSFKKYGEWLIREFGVPRKIGIGTICKAGIKESVQETVSLIRKLFPEAWIHVFGLRIHHLNAIDTLIDSWDSMAWTFPRGRGRKSAGKKVERVQYFAEYIESIPQKMSNEQSLMHYVRQN